MRMENNDFFSGLGGQFFKPFAQVQFFRGKQLQAEAADLPEGSRFTEDE